MFLDHHQARNAHNQGYRTLDPLKLNFADLPVAVVGHNQGYRTLDPLKRDNSTFGVISITT